MPTKSTKLKVWKMSHTNFIISIFGFCIALSGVITGMFWQQIFNYMIAKEVTLRPDSIVYNHWKKPPMELALDIYLFNWTNPEDIRNKSAKPNFQQLGPYRFKENPDKVDIIWNPDNNTVTYRRKSDYYFDEEYSQGTLNDEITMLNPVAISAAATAKHWSSMRQNMINMGFNVYNQEISVTKTADEWLFTGYSDTMMDMARIMPVFGDDVKVPFDKFGWFYTRNGTADLMGVFNVYTGNDDISKIGQMHTWNYQSHSDFFEGECSLIKGSAGEFQPPNLREGGSVDLFTPDMCRPIPLDYVESVEIEGVLGYKFAGGQRSVDNGSIYAENTCFCGGECVPSGVMNISSCRFGSPVFMSYPHFFGADQYYLDQVQGMKPNEQDHQFYMILEPNTGVPLEVAARFQVNMMLEPIGKIELYENIPRKFMPLIWFEQKVRISPALAAELSSIPKVVYWGPICCGIMFTIGVVIMLWHPIGMCFSRVRVYDTDHVINKSQQSLNLQSSSKHLENGSIKKTGFSEKDIQEPDGSPLLDKSKIYPKIGILNRQETIDSVKTNTSVYSDKD